MKLLIINPNSTASMTAKITACGRRFAAPGTEIRAVNPADSPKSIEGYYDDAMSLRGLHAELNSLEFPIPAYRVLVERVADHEDC
jgi:allantoin racemase